MCYINLLLTLTLTLTSTLLLSVCLSRNLWKIGGTDFDAVWGDRSGGSKDVQCGYVLIT